MKRIFVVGSINTDFVIQAPYMPATGESLAGSGFFTARGGKGANQAVACARLGGSVSMCGCVGSDSFGKEAIDALKKEGIDTSCIRTVPNTPTGTAVIVVVNGDNRIIVDNGANNRLEKSDVDRALTSAKAGDVLLTQLENPIDVVGYALGRAKEKGMFTVLNPAPANKNAEKYYGYCDLVTPNETEAEILGGREALAKKIPNVIVTLGEKGYEIIRNGNAKRFPCIKITPIDTTAAGDTFCGGLCARLADSTPDSTPTNESIPTPDFAQGSASAHDFADALERAAEFASAAASIACTRHGAQPSIPTKSEVNACLKMNARHTRS